MMSIGSQPLIFNRLCTSTGQGAKMSRSKFFVLESETLVPKDLEETFAFFENPRNLALITPPQLQFVIESKEPVVMAKGVEIDYTIRWLGLRLAWRTLVSDYAPPFRFVDVQARGPYRFWRHTHS